MIVIAHRGSSLTIPENTVPAIKKAIRDRADAIEIDVQVTKDEKLIVIHDEWLNRTTNGKGFIHETPYSYIKQLDAGSWFNEAFTGTKVPLLEEILSVVKKTPIDLNIELKNNLFPYPGLEKKVIEMVQSHGMGEQVILSSFRKDSLALCKQLCRGIRRGYLCLTTFAEMSDQPEWQELGLYSIHPQVSFIRKNISTLQDHGYKIFPYNITRKKELALCLQYHVDGLFTNSPKRVKQILLQKTSRR